MSKIFTHLKTLFIAFILIGLSFKVNAQCVPNFTFSTNANGNVTFTSTSTGTTSSSNYQWLYGDNSSGGGVTASHNYTANGVYNVTLVLFTPPSCSVTTNQTVQITNAPTPTCLVQANFTYTQSANGLVNFESTSTNTISSTTYSWNFGDNTSGTGITTSHTYASNNFFNATLFVDNGNNCNSYTYINIPINTYPCGLAANFNYTLQANGNANFISTSTGTSAIALYNWYRDGIPFGSSNSASGNFTNGTHTITLGVNNNYSTTPCANTASQVITVSNNTCNLQSSYTFTQGSNGLVTFASACTGTSANTTYYWDFGDGFNTTGVGPHSHTYSNAGYYYPSLSVQESNALSCHDSVSIPVNVTSAPCVANSNFTLTMLSPGVWQATPIYPYNVIWAQWSWGDNTTSNQLITAHTYSPTGLYNICLTVSVSCAASSSSSCATYTITRTSSALSMAYVSVVMPPSQSITTGIKQQTIITDNNFFVYPNPTNGKFEISLIGLNEESAKIKVYNITGALIYESIGNIEYGNLNHTVKLNQAPGIYFVKVESGSAVITKKIILKD